MESMTISSRLRASNGRLGTLQDIEDTINSTGRRRIAKFGMSLSDPDVLIERTADSLSKAERAGSTTSRSTDDGHYKMENFDIDAFSKDYKLASIKSTKREHIFARAESYRGAWQLSEHAGRHPRDRFGDAPAVER